jgi:hypothetical protein
MIIGCGRLPSLRRKSLTSAWQRSRSSIKKIPELAYDLPGRVATAGIVGAIADNLQAVVL